MQAFKLDVLDKLQLLLEQYEAREHDLLRQLDEARTTAELQERDLDIAQLNLRQAQEGAQRERLQLKHQLDDASRDAAAALTAMQAKAESYQRKYKRYKAWYLMSADVIAGCPRCLTRIQAQHAPVGTNTPIITPGPPPVPALPSSAAPARTTGTHAQQAAAWVSPAPQQPPNPALAPLPALPGHAAGAEDQQAGPGHGSTAPRLVQPPSTSPPPPAQPPRSQHPAAVSVQGLDASIIPETELPTGMAALAAALEPGPPPRLVAASPTGPPARLAASPTRPPHQGRLADLWIGGPAAVGAAAGDRPGPELNGLPDADASVPTVQGEAGAAPVQGVAPAVWAQLSLALPGTDLEGSCAAGGGAAEAAAPEPERRLAGDLGTGMPAALLPEQTPASLSFHLLRHSNSQRTPVGCRAAPGQPRTTTEGDREEGPVSHTKAPGDVTAVPIKSDPQERVTALGSQEPSPRRAVVCDDSAKMANGVERVRGRSPPSAQRRRHRAAAVEIRRRIPQDDDSPRDAAGYGSDRPLQHAGDTLLPLPVAQKDANTGERDVPDLPAPVPDPLPHKQPESTDNGGWRTKARPRAGCRPSGGAAAPGPAPQQPSSTHWTQVSILRCRGFKRRSSAPADATAATPDTLVLAERAEDQSPPNVALPGGAPHAGPPTRRNLLNGLQTAAQEQSGELPDRGSPGDGAQPQLQQPRGGRGGEGGGSASGKKGKRQLPGTMSPNKRAAREALRAATAAPPRHSARQAFTWADLDAEETTLGPGGAQLPQPPPHRQWQRAVGGRGASATAATPPPDPPAPQRSGGKDCGDRVAGGVAGGMRKPGFKYQEVVRGAAREALGAYACNGCRVFYEAMASWAAPGAAAPPGMRPSCGHAAPLNGGGGRSGGSAAYALMQEVGRHRARHAPGPSTPDDFWALTFPVSGDRKPSDDPLHTPGSGGHMGVTGGGDSPPCAAGGLSPAWQGRRR